MDAEHNLRRFCALKGIHIARERDMDYGKQFTLQQKNEIVDLVLFPNSAILQGQASRLKETFSIWANSYEAKPEGAIANLPMGWKEWREEAFWLEDYHFKYGTPYDDDVDHRYRIARETLFHDYMFRNSNSKSLPFSTFERLIRNWFYRNCFMNINIDLFISNINKRLEELDDPFNSGEIGLDMAAEVLSYEFSSHCPSKCYWAGQPPPLCLQTKRDYTDCLVDMVDALFPYFSRSILSYTKGNLTKILKRNDSVKWKSIEPSTQIEQKMSESLLDAGVLTIPQYQAFDSHHRYTVDFVIKTPTGETIAIECDGLQFHARASTYIRDRKRDRYLQKKGFYVMRFSSVEIFNEMEHVLKEIDQAYWKLQRKKLDMNKPYRTSYFGFDEE